ncbi:Bcr/CflA family drug resistance efflux transporter [Acidovorax carolinensis]|uniref:Bcr/CflA family efflux transporter n=1 Tax=Acidovorax carolinensis TaxID=553814 RepID=A0A240U774_9BURK|nr:multidrug effflux MFS transporter [Acidovorax carolinensis]ART53686.1 Bcr/CflA family drug resistance efflux transporter [Acidovorax carolinensis]
MSATSNTAAPTAAPIHPGLAVLVLALLLGLQPVTTDLYLPALPTIKAQLQASMAQSQLTLTALLLAFGCSQLVWGPLSDRWGRRPILLTGLVAYVLAALGCALAQSMEALIFWRTVQGAAMGAGVMGARAVVRDLYAPVEGAHAMSRALTGLGIIACLSPPLGGLLAGHLGWRATMAALGCFGGLALLLILLRFEETLARPNPLALHPTHLLRTWVQILRHPTFLAFSATTTFTYAGLFTYLAASSFTFIQVLGWSPTAYGLLLSCNAAMYITGTVLCRRLLVRWGLRRSMALAGLLSATGGTLMGVAALAGVQSGWAYALPFLLYQIAHGIHMPCSQSGAVGPFPKAAGTAAALNGFVMMLVAFGMGHWLGQRMDGTVLPLALGVWFWSLCLALAAWTLVQQFGEPAKA